MKKIYPVIKYPAAFIEAAHTKILTEPSGSASDRQSREIWFAQKIEISNEFGPQPYRFKKLQEEIQKSKRISLIKTAKRGISEEFFEIYLRSAFGNHAIQTGFIIDGRTKYTPDFVYLDIITNLHIDIEIDEPYDLGTKSPIHFIDPYGNNPDDIRDEYFLNNGWIVIRFAESQIAYEPDRCCWVIEKVIKLLTNKTSFNEDFILEPTYYPIQKMQGWTKFEADEMVKQRYRENYLDRFMNRNML